MTFYLNNLLSHSVPVGTVVRRLKQYKRVEPDIIDENFDWQAYVDAEDDFDCEEEDQEPVLLADLNQPGENVLVAQGGMGGRGNRGECAAIMVNVRLDSFVCVLTTAQSFGDMYTAITLISIHGACQVCIHHDSRSARWWVHALANMKIQYG